MSISDALSLVILCRMWTVLDMDLAICDTESELEGVRYINGACQVQSECSVVSAFASS